MAEAVMTAPSPAQAADTTKDKMPAKRDVYGALREVPDWVTALLRDLEAAGAWQTGIWDGRTKKERIAVNADVYSYDDARKLALVQLREAVLHPRRPTRVRKDYFLIGRNENGTPFAHAVDIRAAGRVVGPDIGYGVRLALSRIWECAIEDLDDVIRQGDIAFVPVSALPADAEEIPEREVVLRESHRVRAWQGATLYRCGGTYYLRGPATARHAKGQHPVTRVRGGVWRIQPAIRWRTWGIGTSTRD